jgi:hypothetical protein
MTEHDNADGWNSHNHGPSEARGLDCPEKPIGHCVRAANADEVTRLRRWKEEATEVILGLQDLGRALGLPLGERITGESAAEAAEALTARAEAAEAALTRVRALAEEWRIEDADDLPTGDRALELRAALDPASPATRPSPAPADDEGAGTGAAPSEGHSEARGPRCMVEGCDKADAHAFLTITDAGLAHYREGDV